MILIPIKKENAYIKVKIKWLVIVILNGIIPKTLLKNINRKIKKYNEIKEYFFIKIESCILTQINKKIDRKKSWKLSR